jgi:hypothetical protein
MIYKDGSSYDGIWKNNLENGNGIHKDISGWTYTGEFKNGIKNGYGKITYKDGSYYEGLWKNNLKYGQGTHTYFDAQGKYFGKYMGEFLADKRNGKGEFIYASGYKQTGLWKDDSFLG